jgi:hypothetical protein
MSTSAHRDSLPEHPDRDLIDYRPISGWAMAALLLGLAAGLALVHPLLLCVPIAGIAVAMIALRRIERSPVKLLGRKAALVGLAFSVIYGVAAPVRLKSRDHWLSTRAERLADEFLDDVRSGKTDEAFALCLRSVEKMPAHNPRGTPDEKGADEPQDGRKIFFSEQPVAKLLEWRARAERTRLHTEVLLSDGPRQPVVVMYQIRDGGSSEAAPVDVLFYVEEIVDGEGTERWWISRVSVPPRSPLSQ